MKNRLSSLLCVLVVSCGQSDTSNKTYWSLDKALRERGPSVVVEVVGNNATLRDTTGQYYTLTMDSNIADDLEEGDLLQ